MHGTVGGGRRHQPGRYEPSERAEVRRRLSARPEVVFAAFGSADIVTRWLTPAPDVKLTVLELDVRQGGRYRFAYDTPEGQRMLVGGVYRKIEAPTRLEFSWLIEPPDIHAGIESHVIDRIGLHSGSVVDCRSPHGGAAPPHLYGPTCPRRRSKAVRIAGEGASAIAACR